MKNLNLTDAELVLLLDLLNVACEVAGDEVRSDAPEDMPFGHRSPAAQRGVLHYEALCGLNAKVRKAGG